jgi:hypothetical protein
MQNKIIIILSIFSLLTLQTAGTNAASNPKHAKRHHEKVKKPRYELVKPVSQSLKTKPDTTMLTWNGAVWETRQIPLPKVRKYAAVRLHDKWGIIDDIDGTQLIVPKYDEISDVFFLCNQDRRHNALLGDYREDMAPIIVRDKWGFKDRAGNEVVEPQYQLVRPFFDGIAAVQKDGLWGFIDKKGREIVALQYDAVGNFHEGLAFVSVKSKENPMKRLYGFIDKTGSEIVPLKYDKVGDFNSEGTARVSIASGNSAKPFLIGFIDKTGREIIPLRYPSLGEMHDGMAMIAVDANNESGVLFGFINRRNETVVPPVYSSVGDFHEGRAAVRRTVKNGKYTFIDTTGREIFPAKYDDVKPFSEGLAAVMKRGPYDSKLRNFRNKWGFIDKTGKEVIPVKYASASSFKDGRAEVSGAIHYIDKKGRKAGTPKTPEEKPNLNEYMIRVGQNGKYGYADFKGREVVPVQFDELPPVLAQSLNRVKLNGKYGYLDVSANEALPAFYDELPLSLNGKFNRIMRNGKYGYLDGAGKEVIPAKYDDAPEQLARSWSGDTAVVRVSAGGKYGYLFRDTGQEVSPTVYEIAPRYLDKEGNKVKRDGKWGSIDGQGRVVSEFRYEDDPCAFHKKSGEHYVFRERAVMRSKPDPNSDVIAQFSPGAKLTIGSGTTVELTQGDEADKWYEATSGEKKGFVWGGDIADSAFTVSAESHKLLFLIRNRTNTEQCYKFKFEMKMLLDGKVLSEHSDHSFDKTSSRVISMEYLHMEGFSAPLNLLKVKSDFKAYKDAYARFGTGVTYFYIDDGKLNKVLTVAEEVGGEGKFSGHKFIGELDMPDNKTRVDSIISTVYSATALSKTVFSKETYQWDWDAKTFKKIR